MDRRKFIKNTASFLSLPVLINGQAIQVFGANSYFNPEDTNGKALVLIQLDGGNDGLNTLIPLDMYDNLAKVRPHVVLPREKILPLTDLQGLHPSMEKIKELYDAEKMLFIQNVGYPQPNLSHFRSKEIVLSASDSQTVISSGWFGRYLETLHPDYPDNYPNENAPHPLAISIGNSSSPTCQGDLANMSVVLQNLNTTYESQSDENNFPETPYGNELEYVTGVMKSTEKYLEVVAEHAENSSSLSSHWPEDNSLANKLKIVARLIAGGLTTPVYIVNLGGFDTHANQVVPGDTVTGKHADLLKLLSEAVFAFQDEIELQNKEDDVIGMVYSEFGRRIASNNSNGTDHGAAYPMMLFGSRINPKIFGTNPVIPEAVEKKTNVPMETDFRSVYASILKYWFEKDESIIQEILFDNFELQPILKSAVGLDQLQNNSKELRIMPVIPNPVKDYADIQFFTQSGNTTIEVYNATGQKISVLVHKDLPEGNHNVRFSARGLAKGQYIIVLKNNQKRTTQTIIVF